MMAHPSDHRLRLCSVGFARCVLLLVGLLLVCFVVARPILWHLRENSFPPQASSSCPSCDDCDCSSDVFPVPPLDDCGKNDPELSEELGKDMISLLSEELSLQKNVSDDNLTRTKALITEAKRTSTHLQKEAEKCNTGMETCEEAREKAEAALIGERKFTSLWQKRAHEHGWKDERRMYS